MKCSLIRAVPVVLLIGCSPRSPRSAPLAQYSRLGCLSLGASYDDSSRVPPAPPPAVDPALGWDDEVKPTPGACKRPDTKTASYCKRVHGTEVFYTGFQERPLDALRVDAAFRAAYTPFLGASVVIRAVRVDGKASLVAKVLQRFGGPLAWIETRRLSDAEWSVLQRAASRLPDGHHEYFSVPEKGPAEQPQCAGYDGAEVEVERLEGGVIRIGNARYEQPDDATCPGKCCDRNAEALSRFFDLLASLVKCPRASVGH